MHLINSYSVAILACAAHVSAGASVEADNKPYKPVMRSLPGMSLVRRDTGGYQPEQSQCHDGQTCAEACGSGFTQCPSNDQLTHCFNPSAGAGQSCCSDGSGNSCDQGYYCTHDHALQTWCCPDGMDLVACAKAYSVTGGLDAVSALASSTIASSSSTSASISSGTSISTTASPASTTSAAETSSAAQTQATSTSASTASAADASALSSSSSGLARSSGSSTSKAAETESVASKETSVAGPASTASVPSIWSGLNNSTGGVPAQVTGPGAGKPAPSGTSRPKPSESGPPSNSAAVSSVSALFLLAAAVVALL